uniref:Acetylcholinesterase n=1 Tax=Ambigolimax valentianus TaxID=1338344 RepID=U3U3Q0_9EUPU|nr:acetylcholinesterase [Ambigolimax valentianus]
MTLQILMTAIVILPVVNSLSISQVSLSTTLGIVAGDRKQTEGNKIVNVFHSIPFAKPPVGDLRFRSPLPAEPWVGILDGTQRPKACWQSLDKTFGNFSGSEMWNPNTPRSEDCLYLNVWKPVGGEEVKTILVWIYGGGFISGTTTLDIYDGTQLAALSDVIVVSIAYRIGPLGFLYLNSDEAPGNAGLLDQALALKWVKDNALNLGGSPDSITIFGESAGAASVGFHLISPVSKDLFNYAILQSASELADWAIHEPSLAKDISLKLAAAVLCSENNISASINCLRSIQPQVLCDLQGTLVTSVPFPFTPVIDHYFMPEHPREIIQKGGLKKTNILLGVNKNEGIYFNIYDFIEDYPLQGNGEITESQFDEIFPKYCDKTHLDCDQIKEGYIDSSNVSYKDLLDDITGDIYFKCPVVNLAKLFQQRGGRVFLYSFEHRLSTNPWPEWTGVVHGYEIELVFGMPFSPTSVYTEEEKQLSLLMMELWTSFAKTGNPNFNSSNQWPEYTEDSKEYVAIDATGLKVGHGLRESQCAILANATTSSQTPDFPAQTAPTTEAATSLTVDAGNLIRQVFQVFLQ